MQPQPQQTTTVISVPAQQPMQYVVPVRTPGQRVFPKFPSKQALCSGILLIVAASLSIIFNIVELAVSYSAENSAFTVWWVFGNVGHGFWVGVMCIIPGGLGIGASKYKTKCLINAFNVMCIIGASFAAMQFSIALPGAIVGPQCRAYQYFYNYYSYYSYGSYSYNNCFGIGATDVAMEALLTSLALIEAAAAIWGSALCCRTTCCCSCCLAEPRPSVQVAQPYGTQLMVIGSNQQMQPVMVQGYPNVAYQPGYPGQPTQFTSMTPMYPPQGQFIAAGPPPPQYPGPYNNFQYGAQPAQPVNEQKFDGQAQAYPAST